MCGIVGYIGSRDAVSVLLSGLKRLEYRGYDSSGVAVAHPNKTLELEKATGKTFEELENEYVSFMQAIYRASK